MAYKIDDGCIQCDTCRPQCPTGAIYIDQGKYEIEAKLCNNCEGYYEQPLCVVRCPTSIPAPLQAKKGRNRVEPRTPTSPDLFPNGKNHAYASSIVVWEACNLLAQRKSLIWEEEADTGALSYRRTFNQHCLITLKLTDTVDEDPPMALRGAKALSTLRAMDIRAAAMHLIYAAHATTLDRPWEQEFVISDRQIEEYLGLDKRKDLSKPAKLTIIKEIAQQPCFIKVAISCPPQGRVRSFVAEESRLWHLLEIQHHFQEDDQGCKHLTGLTFRIRPGIWTQYFLNRDGCREHTAFYQYGMLPRSVLTAVMSIWQQHEGAARIMMWLLFKVRIGRDQRITVPTLMRIAYGEEKITQASHNREDRKRLLRTFESDLEAMSHYGLKPLFDPETYPTEIQPLWAKLEDLPDDAEAALEFWTNDGSSENRLTDIGPRGKWNMLMNARILGFELPHDWEQPMADRRKKQQRLPRGGASKQTHQHNTRKPDSRKIIPRQEVPTLTGEQIVTARKTRGLSQRELATQTGKSQSWIRDIENGRFRAKLEDQALLCKVLGLG